MICEVRHSLTEFQNNFNDACGCDRTLESSVPAALSTGSLPPTPVQDLLH